MHYLLTQNSLALIPRLKEKDKVIIFCQKDNVTLSVDAASKLLKSKFTAYEIVKTGSKKETNDAIAARIAKLKEFKILGEDIKLPASATTAPAKKTTAATKTKAAGTAKKATTKKTATKVATTKGKTKETDTKVSAKKAATKAASASKTTATKKATTKAKAKAPAKKNTAIKKK